MTKVEHDRVENPLTQKIEALNTVGRALAGKTVQREKLGKRLAKVLFVVDDQHAPVVYRNAVDNRYIRALAIIIHGHSPSRTEATP